MPEQRRVTDWPRNRDAVVASACGGGGAALLHFVLGTSDATRARSVLQPAARSLSSPSRATMASSYSQFSPARLRSYVLRLPLATRLLLLAIVGLWIAAIPLPWLREFARLEPAKMDLTQSTSTLSCVRLCLCLW